jgi:hypothetical protein
MNVHAETQMKKEFVNGMEITLTVVFDEAVLVSQTFSNKTHQIEELLDYIAYNEIAGCDVFF